MQSCKKPGALPDLSLVSQLYMAFLNMPSQVLRVGVLHVNISSIGSPLNLLQAACPQTFKCICSFPTGPRVCALWSLLAMTASDSGSLVCLQHYTCTALSLLTAPLKLPPLKAPRGLKVHAQALLMYCTCVGKLQ